MLLLSKSDPVDEQLKILHEDKELIVERSVRRLTMRSRWNAEEALTEKDQEHEDDGIKPQIHHDSDDEYVRTI